MNKEKEYFVKHMDFYHPPLLPMPDVPISNHYGAYLQKRKNSVHTGVDLYAPEGSSVFAIEKGKVVIVKWFTGDKDGSPWWNNTKAVYIKGYTGTMCYGEVIPTVEEGEMVEKGQIIANVTPVLKHDKGKAMSMLHFALHRHGLDLQVKNNQDPNADDFYDLQMDPAMLLIQLKNKADNMMTALQVKMVMQKLELGI